MSGLTERLRRSILNRLHLGQVAPGDRLPGVREMARETGEDHRAVSRAYHALEEEGLVEVRGRSGVYLSSWVAAEDNSPPDDVLWVAEMLAGARRRHLPIPEVVSVLHDIVEAEPPRCVLVESSEDMLAAYGHELRAGYGMTVAPVDADALACAPERSPLFAPFGEADLVVTTRYHTAAVAPHAKRFGVPLVALAVDQEAVQDVTSILRRRLRQGPLSVVVADPRFVDRLKNLYGDIVQEGDEIRYLLASDSRALNRLEPGERVVLTRAASERLGKAAPPVFLFHAPLLAPRTVRELCTHVVRLAFRRRGSRPSSGASLSW